MQRQLALWRTHLPTVAPHYAVKCNDSPLLLRWVAEEQERARGAAASSSSPSAAGGFDCASLHEMRAAVGTGLVSAGDILYAHPCKPPTEILGAQALGVQRTVVDSEEEVDKLADAGWRGSVLLRLRVPDGGSRQPFGKKFGAKPERAGDILRAASRRGVRMEGVSFHVGSECERPEQFDAALAACRQVFDAAEAAGVRGLRTIDVGGGFLPDATHFAAAASAIRGAQARLFPTGLAADGRPLQWLAEPGRFLAAPTHTLFVPVIGRKRGEDGAWCYTLDESVYGAFSNVIMDGARPVFEVALRRKARLQEPSVAQRCTLFGRTCDSADTLSETAVLPELHVGDSLRVANMGAYTRVTATEFNGFPLTQAIYVDDRAEEAAERREAVEEEANTQRLRMSA